jgi:hypothetical protein
LGTALFYSASMFAYVFYIGLALYTANNYNLYLGDFFGRSLLYIGSLFAIQITLYNLWPKSKKRFFASFVLGLISLFYIIYNYLNPNHPYIDRLQIVHWEASPVLASGLAVVLFTVWVPASIVFFHQFYKSKFKSLKAFLLGSGFLLGAITGILQDYVVSTVGYLNVNLFLSIGFILIFSGLFYDEK